MAGLLSGLKDLGLENLENRDIFEAEKKEEAVKKQVKIVTPDIPKEPELIFDKTMECPVCGKKFMTKIVKSGRAKLISTDMDLRPKYEGIDVIKYDVIQCTHCGYAALNRYFADMMPSKRKLIQEYICSKVVLRSYSDDIYTYDDAINRYKLALANAVVKHSKNSEKAYICLKSAWLMRGYIEYLSEQKDTDAKTLEEAKAAEGEYLWNAYNGFIEARKTENTPICGMDQYTLEYLLAALAFRFKEMDTAGKMISSILGSSYANKRIKEKTLLLKEDMIAEIKKNSKS